MFDVWMCVVDGTRSTIYVVGGTRYALPATIIGGTHYSFPEGYGALNRDGWRCFLPRGASCGKPSSPVGLAVERAPACVRCVL